MLRAWTWTALLTLPLVSAAHAAIPGTDTFQDGTLQTWDGAVDANIATGGPAGAGDRYLEVSAGAFGITPHLATFNDAVRWTGSYTAAGITSIDADIRIFEGSALSMRVMLLGGSSTISRATSTSAISVPADGLWHHVSFSVAPASLTLVLGSDSISNILTTVNRVMIRHQSGPPNAGGSPVSALVGLDNISALPEPSAALLLGCACGWFSLHGRRRR